MSYLLDTDVLSEVIKKRPAPSVMRRLAELRGKPLTTSVISVFELKLGAAKHPRVDRLGQRICRDVLPLVHVLPLGPEEAARAALEGGVLCAVDEDRAAGLPSGVMTPGHACKQHKLIACGYPGRGRRLRRSLYQRRQSLSCELSEM